jgi:nucleotide-binding universal stress UspA family protein
MKWLVGLDMRPRSTGAIGFAVWMARTSNSRVKDAVLGVHVVEMDDLLPQLEDADEETILGSLRAPAIESMKRAAMEAEFATPLVTPGRHAERTLEAATVFHNAAGLVVGRAAATDELSLVRLGRVARRLLRTLSVPLIVTPPDLAGSSVGSGPILVSVDPEHGSRSHVDFALRLGAWLNREVHLIHVVPIPDRDVYADYLPTAAWEQHDQQLEERGRASVDTWINARLGDEAGKFGPERRIIERGPVVPRVVDAAKRLDACMVVCGSRKMSLARRFLTPSVASELAASAPFSVAVIAPGAADDDG